MWAFNAFNSLDLLEPRCVNCRSRIDYGVTTRYDEKRGCHVCLSCGRCMK